MSSRRSSAKTRHVRDQESRRKRITQLRAWRAIHQPAVNARRRHRWATDPQYRAKKLAETSRSAERRRLKAAKDSKYRAKLVAAKRAATRRGFLRSAYGITPEDYEALLARQRGACAICGKRPQQTLCVDHCHVTGKVRGLLCKRCNFGLGHYHDDPDLVEAAAAYLRRTS